MENPLAEKLPRRGVIAIIVVFVLTIVLICSAVVIAQKREKEAQAHSTYEK